MKKLSGNRRMSIAIAWISDEITMNDAAKMFGITSNPRNVLGKLSGALRDACRAGIIKTRL